MAIGGVSNGQIEVYTLSNTFTSFKEVEVYSPKTGNIDFRTFKAAGESNSKIPELPERTRDTDVGRSKTCLLSN